MVNFLKTHCLLNLLLATRHGLATVSKSPITATSHPLCPFFQTTTQNKNHGSRHEHRPFSSTVCYIHQWILLVLCCSWPAIRCMFVSKWNMLPAPSFLCCSTSETRTGKRADLLREACQPKQSLVGADCHVPKVTS